MCSRQDISLLGNPRFSNARYAHCLPPRETNVSRPLPQFDLGLCSNQLRLFVLSPRIELGSPASQANILSIKLREHCPTSYHRNYLVSIFNSIFGCSSRSKIFCLHAMYKGTLHGGKKLKRQRNAPNMELKT